MWRKLSRYTIGSVVAAGCSELALVLCYGVIHLSPGLSSVIAWVAGAVPNYWLNRSWTWQQKGRPSLRREVVPYVVVILLTLLIAVVTTRAVDAELRDSSEATRTVLVALTFLGVYVGMFLVRYFLFDRLFRGLDTRPSGAARPPEGPSGAARPPEGPAGAARPPRAR